MAARFKVALTRGVASSFAKALSRTPSPLSVEHARAQNQRYVQAISKYVSKVVEVPSLDDTPDCCFIEDTAVAVGSTVLLTTPGALSRRAEVSGVEEALRSLKPFVERIVKMEDYHAKADNADATMDGGDVLYTGRHCFVGLSSRTNHHGLEALKELLGPALPGGKESVFGFEVVDDLHLKCVVTHAGNNQLAVNNSDGGRLF
eukprot:47799-Rhodomonas_salina.1